MGDGEDTWDNTLPVLTRKFLTDCILGEVEIAMEFTEELRFGDFTWQKSHHIWPVSF